MRKASQAESHCVDGDIRLVAEELEAAALAYLRAFIADGVVAKEHVASLSDEQRDTLVSILYKWTNEGSSLPTDIAFDQVWEFIFCLEPEAVTSFFAKVESLFKEGNFRQIVNCTSAVLKQCPVDVVPLLLQRGLARALMGGADKAAISDYLRAYLKDKEATIEVAQSQQRDHFACVQALMRKCVYSNPPAHADGKAYKQWLGLTIDCSRFLLTFEPENFALQMTFVSRLMDANRYDRAIVMLDEITELLRDDPDKMTEVFLQKSLCYFAKQDNDRAIHFVTIGLNLHIDVERKKTQSDDEIEFVLKQSERTIAIVQGVFNQNTKPLAVVVALLEKAATRLAQEDRFQSGIKLENIRKSIDYYRAALALQPDNKDAIFKLASCFANFGKFDLAIRLLNRLINDSPLDFSAIAARAACYRELGNKVGAMSDYDLLLHHCPRDVTFLCERALVLMEDDNIASAVNDLLMACNIDQKSVVVRLNREPLVRRTRVRQALFDYAKSKLKPPEEQSEQEAGDQTANDVLRDDSIALGISQLLTRLNPADQSCHILAAHAMFHSGCVNDAETKLKKMLQGKQQGIDIHVIRIHLGIMKIFTRRQDDGMADMIDVFSSKGERVFLAILRDIPIPERAQLSEASHQHGIGILQSSRSTASVRQAVKSFTIAILFCRETDLVLEGRSEGTGFHRSYLARAECMAHLGEQRAAVLDFSAALEIQPLCVDALCGRAFMHLALGEEADCVSDVTIACDLDLDNVVTHIHALPEEAKKLLLFWIDHRVVALLLNYGYRSNERINTGGSASTISMLDETVFKPGEDVSRSTSLSSIHPPSIPDDLTTNARVLNGKALHKSGTKGQEFDKTLPSLNKPSSLGKSDLNASPIQPAPIPNATPTLEDSITNMTPNNDEGIITNMTPNDPKSSTPADMLGNTTDEPKINQKKSNGDLNRPVSKNDSDATLSNNETEAKILQKTESFLEMQSRGSASTSIPGFDEPMERLEVLRRAMALGRLLVTIDEGNASWQSMFADVLIVKGDYDEALRHLLMVMELTPNDMTATARAGLINVKMNRYKSGCRLLGAIANADGNGLKYVLKALDAAKRKRLCEEAFNYAEALNRESKFAASRDCYALSILADSYMKLDSLRMRSRCHAKLGDVRRAIIDISDVIKELARKPQAHDYCYRGLLYLLENKEFQACRDYMQAIEIDRTQASALIHARPGHVALCEVFHKQAQQSFARRNFHECADLCDVALLVDESNINLRKLRARARRETSKCVLQ